MVKELDERMTTKDKEQEKKEQIERGNRIRQIREKLNMNKSELARKIGISGQFLGLIEEGKGNLAYRSIKKLMDLSAHSADYILYGLDDSIINDTKLLLKEYDEEEIIRAMGILKEIAIFIKEEKVQKQDM